MFFKRFLYKITTPKKYHEYKTNISLEKKIKWYKSGFQKKIEDIQKKIGNQKELSFLHSGHLGDVINALPLIKEVSKSKKCNYLIEAKKPIPNHAIELVVVVKK